MNRLHIPAWAIMGLVITLGASEMRAALTFNLDPFNKTFYLSGSDFGTPGPNSLDGRVYWEADYTMTSTQLQNVLIESTVDATSGISIFSPTELRVFGNGVPQRFRVDVYPNTTTPQTISGLGIPVSYASLNADHQADLEAFVADGGILFLRFGGDFDSIQTLLVPESSAIGLLAFLGMAVGIWRIGRRRTAARPGLL